VAIPSKGRLVEPTMSLLSSIGLRPQPIDEKALIILTNWPWLSLIRIRPEDIPGITESGSALMSITPLRTVTNFVTFHVKDPDTVYKKLEERVSY